MLFAVTSSVSEKSVYQAERLYGFATNGSATTGQSSCSSPLLARLRAIKGLFTEGLELLPNKRTP